MWEKFSTILNIILGILTVYFYLENRKLKGFEIEKNLKIKKAELIKLEDDHFLKSSGSVHSSSFNFSIYETEKETNEFNYKKICLMAKIKYLKKLRQYKWLFTKIK